MGINIKETLLRFDALSQREKLMTTCASLLIVWACWDNLLYQPLNKQHKALVSAMTSLRSDLSVQKLSLAQLEQNAGQNPTQQKLVKLRQSVDSLKQQLYAGEKKIVPPQMMAAALRDILQHHGTLKLLKLETLPAEPFSNDAQQPAWLYRHTLAVTVQGDFFSTLDYLKSLESLPWRIHWDSIDYQVGNYPFAETRIQVYTLSFDKDLLGA